LFVHPGRTVATPRIRLAAKHNSRMRERGNPKTITIVNEDTTGLSIIRRDSLPRVVLTDAVYPARLPGGAVLPARGPGARRQLAKRPLPSTNLDTVKYRVDGVAW
jgi:hypothetical protein